MIINSQEKCIWLKLRKLNCTSRLNIIRFLTQKSWGLNKATLVQIYKSLIRSVIEYIGLSYFSLGPNQRKELEVIQNSALRTILRVKREEGNTKLLETAKIDSVCTRMRKLNATYVQKTINQENPLIIELINSYKESLSKDRERGLIGGITILKQDKYFQGILKKEGLL